MERSNRKEFGLQSGVYQNSKIIKMILLVDISEKYEIEVEKVYLNLLSPF